MFRCSCRVRRRDVLELRQEGMLAAVAQPVVEVNYPLRLLGYAPAQHAHHRRDADAAGDQHRGQVRFGIDEEMAGRGLHAQDVTDPHMIMEVAGRQARREFRMIRRRAHAFDRHPVVRGIGSIRQGVAARDRARACRPVQSARRDLQGEGQELARLECRQGQAVHRLQVERALRLCRVLECTLRDPKLSPPRPRRIGLDARRHRGGRHKPGRP